MAFAATLQHFVYWRSALNIVVGVICLLLVATTAFMGPPGAAATTWTSGAQWQQQPQPQRGCLGARLCCPGKNSSCRVQGPRSYGARNTCYCDTACFTTNDCCADLQLACNISKS